MAGPPILEERPKVQTSRRSERQRVQSLMYVDLGSENGGFPLNLSEHGMAFQGIRPLRLDQEIAVTFKLEGVEEPVTAAAKIVWLSESRKGGAIEFVDLPDATRRLIRDWLNQQKQAKPARKTIPPKKMSTIPGVVSPWAISDSPETAGCDSPALTGANMAAKAPNSSTVSAKAESAAAPNLASLVQPAPKEDLALPPVSLRPVPAAPGDSSEQRTANFAAVALASLPADLDEVLAAIANKVSPIQLEAEGSSPAQHSNGLPGSQQPSTNPSQLAAPAESKRRWSNLYAIGIAAAIAIVISGGVVLRTFRGTLPHQTPAKAAPPMPVESAPVAAPEPTPEELPLAPSSADPPIRLSSLVPPLANEQKFPEIPIAPPAPNIFSKSPGRPVTKAAIEQPPAARGNTTNSHSLSAENLQTPRPASPLTQSGTTSAGSSAAAPETTNELPGAGIAGGKISALESKAPAIPAVATGTIEIILDPYPSIRMPAESQKQPSRPGTSLQIGRLVSRIEPVYPPEALRQRLAGTVKVHAVVSPEGTVEASAGADAPAMLSEAALRAIRQWRFEPTLLGGSAIGVEEDITVVFRIAAPHSPAN